MVINLGNTTGIEVDFGKLDDCIADMEKLLAEMDEPSYSKVEFWTSGAAGSGSVVSHLYEFCNDTIDFHKATYNLISNTIKYLKTIRTLKKTDENIAGHM